MPAGPSARSPVTASSIGSWGSVASGCRPTAELDTSPGSSRTRVCATRLPCAPGPLAETWPDGCFERGFVATYSWMKFRRGLEPPGDVETDLRSAEIGEEHAESFGRVVMGSFGLPAAFEDWTAALVGRSGWHCFLAFAGDQPAAAGALYVAGESGLALPGWDAARVSATRCSELRFSPHGSGRSGGRAVASS